MCDTSLLERVKFLQAQITRIQAANQAYFKKRFHSLTEIDAHARREERLCDIMDELALLGKKMKAA